MRPGEMACLWWMCKVGCLAADGAAQTALTWPEVRARFEANNPTLQAGQIGIGESKIAAEIHGLPASESAAVNHRGSNRP